MRTANSDSSEEKPKPSASRKDEDRPRVEQLRKKYREGAYKVDAAKLSKKIVDDHLQR